MLRILLLFLFISPALQAQEFDLSKMPEGFSFQSQGGDGLATVRYIRREGQRYIFEEMFVELDGTTTTTTIHTNRASQTTYSELNGDGAYYYPHDCAPFMGSCDYTWTDKDDRFEMRAITRLVGDVWVSEEYFLDQGEWVFWNKDCATFDEFGFWVDFVRIFDNGDSYFGARVRQGDNRLDELWNICQPPELTS